MNSPLENAWRLGVAVLAATIAVFPLYFALMSALRPDEDVFRYLSPLSVRTFLPNRLTFENVRAVWASPFSVAMLNSAIVSVATIVLGLVICSMAAFALAVLRLPFRGAIFAVVVISFLIPFEAIAIPLASLFRDLSLQNTYLGLILPGIGNGFAVFLLRQFFLGIPHELSEAARMDGCSWFGIYWRIYLPLSVPPLITAGLILFVFQWQSFLWPLLIAPDPAFKVAAVAIADFAGQFRVEYGQIFAASALASIVPAAIMLLFQKYFTASLASTGGKE